MRNEDHGLTELINAWSQERTGGDALFRRIMDALRASARRNLYRETGVRWQTTELVNEAFLRLSAQRTPRWQNQQQFFAVLEILMKRCVQEELRHSRRQMRDRRREVAIEDALDLPGVAWMGEGAADLDAALSELRDRDAVKAEVFERKAIQGETFDEIAAVVGRSDRAVRRHWELARAWLALRLTDGHAAGSSGDGSSGETA